MTAKPRPRHNRRKECEHDPDDGGDTCCICGKVMMPAEQHNYEMRLRERVISALHNNMSARMKRDLDAWTIPRARGRKK